MRKAKITLHSFIEMFVFSLVASRRARVLLATLLIRLQASVKKADRETVAE